MLFYVILCYIWAHYDSSPLYSGISSTGAVILLSPCQLSNPEGYGRIPNHNKTQHSTVCMVIRVRFLSSLQWRHNELDGISNHQPHDCLLRHLFRCRSKKMSKLRGTGFYEGNSPVTGEFPTQRASNAENVSIWWHHHVQGCGWLMSGVLICIFLEKNIHAVCVLFWIRYQIILPLSSRVTSLALRHSYNYLHASNLLCGLGVIKSHTVRPPIE